MENSKASETPKTNIKELLVNNFAFLGLILVLVLFEILTGGKLLGQRNLMNIFNNFFSIALCSMMYTFVMALGELDLSVGAIVGFSAAMGAFSATISPALILPVALLTGTGIGLLSGFATAYLRVESFIGTLAISFIFRGLTTYFLNGSVGIPISMRVFDEDWVKILTMIRIIWDISTVGYVVNPNWCPSTLVPTPRLTQDLKWEQDETRHEMRLVRFIYRDALLGDMFSKLQKAPK